MKRTIMTIWLMPLCCSVAYLGFQVAEAQSLQTTQTQLELVRADAGEDAATLAAAFNRATSGDAANRPADAWDLTPYGGVSSGNAPYFHFTTDGDNETFSAACFAYGDLNAPAQLVCTIEATGGSQAVVKWPDTKIDVASRFWVDTAVVTAYWPKTLTAGGSNNSGGAGDTVYTLWFDGMGRRWYKWYVWDADGVTGTETGSVSVWGGYF